MKNNNEAVTLARYMSDFLYDYAPKHLTNSACTLKSYKDALTLYVTFLEDEGVGPGSLAKSCLEKTYIEKWIIWLKERRGCSQATCNVRLASFRTFLDFIGGRDVELKYLALEAREIKRQKDIHKKVTGLSRDAVAALLAAPDPSTRIGRRDLVFMILLYATAARLDEILSIKVGHLKLDAGKPHVTITGKGGKMRTLYLLPKAVSHVRRYIREVHEGGTDPDAYLFFSRVGGKHEKLTEPAMDKRLKLYAQKAHKVCLDVPLNTHAHLFRHAKASHWIEDGLNVLQVSFLLGHAQLGTTMVYLDISTEEKAKAMATLESEKDVAVNKKWKDKDGSLAAFCGLKR